MIIFLVVDKIWNGVQVVGSTASLHSTRARAKSVTCPDKMARDGLAPPSFGDKPNRVTVTRTWPRRAVLRRRQESNLIRVSNEFSHSSQL